jgi:hypothetical protein
VHDLIVSDDRFADAAHERRIGDRDGARGHGRLPGLMAAERTPEPPPALPVTDDRTNDSAARDLRRTDGEIPRGVW